MMFALYRQKATNKAPHKLLITTVLYRKGESMENQGEEECKEVKFAQFNLCLVVVQRITCSQYDTARALINREEQ